jgi:hypothetical protein
MTGSPNWFTYIALLSWPIVALWLYRTRPVNQATLWTILGAQLLLPVLAEFKFPGIPSFDKVSIPNIAALIGCIFVARQPIRFFSRIGLAEVLLLMGVVGPFVTAELNNDPIFIGNVVLPAETNYDALSDVVAQLIILLPFFLGRQVLRSATDNEEILRVLTIAGLLYSLPILFEVRMSPQLHYWFYGYFSFGFAQQVRNDGFRAAVFMGHGLLVAFFVATTAIAAAALWRTRTRILHLAPVGITTYLMGILLLCKSMGPLVYGATLIPLIRFTQPRMQLRIATILVSIALLYPMLRMADLFPTKLLVEAATSISGERADSLAFRFDNEDVLLARASQRLLFGWGRWGRGRVFDQDSGKDISVTDGAWIGTTASFGLFGFFAQFCLLALPVYRARTALKFVKSEHDSIVLAALALIVSVNIVDLLPNASLMPWTWLLAGALLGRAEALVPLSRKRNPDFKLATSRNY